MEPHQESTIVHFFRAGVLLLALIAVPGLAVCWNLFPKDLQVGSKKSIPASPITGESEENGVLDDDEFPVGFNESDRDSYHGMVGRNLTSSSDAAPPLEMESAATPTAPPIVPMPKFDFPITTAEAAPIRTMGYRTDDRTAEQAIPVDFPDRQAVWADAAPKTGARHEIASAHLAEQSPHSQRNFPAIERELKDMGAKYYRLEKWGSRGELFRFSCFVSSKGPYSYQKYFQAIDSDEILVMERVVGDIRVWRGEEPSRSGSPFRSAN